jgi:hypothetical protein
MTGSDKTGFFSGFHSVDKVLDNASLSGFPTISRTNHVHSHQVTLSRSTTPPQSSFTAPLQAPVSTMAWSGPSIPTRALRLAIKSGGQGIAHTCSIQANRFHPSHLYRQPQDVPRLSHPIRLLSRLRQARRTTISQLESSLVSWLPLWASFFLALSSSCCVATTEHRKNVLGVALEM